MSLINVPAESLPQMPAAGVLSKTDLMYILQGSGLDRDRSITIAALLADGLFGNAVNANEHWRTYSITPAPSKRISFSGWTKNVLLLLPTPPFDTLTITSFLLNSIMIVCPEYTEDSKYSNTITLILASNSTTKTVTIPNRSIAFIHYGADGTIVGVSFAYNDEAKRREQIKISGTTNTISTGNFDSDIIFTIDSTHTGSSLAITGNYPHSAMCMIRNKSETSITINWGASITSYFLQPRATMLFFFKADATLENTPEQLFDLTGTKAILSAASLTTTGNIHTDSALQGGSASITGSISSGAATVTGKTTTGSISSGAATVTGKTTTGSFESNGDAKVDGILQVVNALQIVGITTALAEVKANGGVTQNGTPLVPIKTIYLMATTNLNVSYAPYGPYNLGDILVIQNDGGAGISITYALTSGTGTKTVGSLTCRMFRIIGKDGNKPILFPFICD